MASYADSDRSLTVQGLITYPDTLTQAITSTHISSFNIVEDAGRDVPIGAAPASHFLLKLDNSSGQWEPGGSLLGAHSLDGAKIEIEIGLWNGSAYDYSKIGTYYVEDVRGQEHETTITLSGSDAMIPKMSAYFADAPGDYPRTIGALLVDVAAEAGVTLESSTFTNSNVSITAQPNWRNDLTCRDVVGYIAACAGGIAKFNRDGKLDITTLERAASRVISTSVYKRLTRENTTFGALNAINIYAHGAPENTAPVRFATTPATPDTSLNSINIKGNPILANGSSTISSVGTGMLTALSGMSFRGATFDWHGDPSLVLGKICSVTDLSSNSISVLITKQTIKFDAGFEMTSGCDVTTSTKADASNKLQKIFTPTGNLNAEALAGNIYVKAGEKMTLESGSNLNLLSGGAINIKNLSGTANVINMDNTGLTLSSTGQLKLQSASSIIIGGSPFSVGGTNLIPGTSNTYTWTGFNGSTWIQLPYISKAAININDGESLTLSAYIQSFDSARLQARVYSPSGDTNHFSNSTTGGFVKVTFVPKSDYTGVVLYAITTSGESSTSAFGYKKLKLEKGTTATDWSPSPQDTVDALDTLGGRLGDVETRVQVFYQTSKPTYTAVGDLWYDTDSNPLEVWKCTNVSTQAHSAFTDPVLTRALSAQTTANSKITTFVGSSTPTALAAGDLWMDTGNKNIWKRATAAGTGGWVQYLTAAGYLITTGITIDGTDLTVKATGNLNLAADGNLNVQNGGNLNVLNGGDIEVSNGGDINVASGGKITLTTPNDLVLGAQNITAFADGRISAAANTIDLSANTSLNLAVSSIQVGGKNYVRDAGKAFTVTTYNVDISPGGYTVDPRLVVDAKGKQIVISFDYWYATWLLNSIRREIHIVCKDTADNDVYLVASVPSGLSVPNANDNTYQRWSQVVNFPANIKSIDACYFYVNVLNWTIFKNLKIEVGNKPTAFNYHPDDPASGVKTSYIDIATDHIDMVTGGSVNIAAGSDFNVRAGKQNKAIGISNNEANGYMLWAGSDNPTNAPFRVTMDGELTASSIGGNLIIPIANGGTGYNRQTIHRGTDYPSSGFGQDGDLFIFHNGQANSSWSAQTLAYGAAGQNTYFGVNRNWNQVPTAGFYRFGNGVGSSTYDWGAYAYFTAPAAVNSLTFTFNTAKYYNSTWYGYSGTTTYKVALVKASNMADILASTTCYATQNQNTQTVTLTTTSNLTQGSTYYLAVFFDGSDEKTNAGIVGSITMQGKVNNSRTYDLLLKSAGQWWALFGNG